MIKNPATVCGEIFEEIRRIAAEIRSRKVQLRVHPEVARALAGEEAPVLRALGRAVSGEVTVVADPLLHQEQFDLVPL